MKRIAVVGLGLIGGSVAKALKRTGEDFYIIGIDKDNATIESALSDGVIDEGSLGVCKKLDVSVVFVCVHAKQVIKTINQIRYFLNDNTVVTDVCSVKEHIVSEMEKCEGLSFVGGHPMAGTEFSGYEASRADLFDGAFYPLVPCKNSCNDATSIVKILVEMMGAKVIIMDAKAHDRAVATISHIPHIVSAALVNLVEKTDCANNYMQYLAAGGFKGITRISSSEPEMWENICRENKENILEVLNSYAEIIRDFKSALNADDDALYEYFNSAKTFRDKLK